MRKLTAADPETSSTDIIENYLLQLKALFPEAFIEGKVNFDVLKELLGGAVDQREEKYGLNWHGKRQARHLALTPSNGTLRPNPTESVDWNSTQNLMIEGDNLQALKLLQKSYSGKVKLIYIDPPYNTGKDFVYPDKYDDTLATYLRYTGQVDDSGFKISSNTEGAGRFHTTWLNMMYPRLKLARNLLRDDGLIIISIDDGESANLKKICDEIMGEENYVGTFVINSTPNARDYGHIGKMHEYAHFYAKSITSAVTNELETPDKTFRFSDTQGGFNVHPLYNSNEAFTPENRPNLYFPIYLYPNKPIGDVFFEIGFEKTPNAIEIYPPTSERNGVQFVWRWGKPKCQENFNIEIIGYKTEGGEFRIVQKMRHTTKLIRSILDSSTMTTRRGTAEAETILEGKIASFPKPTGLIQTFIQAGMGPDDLLLDFFAGSGTAGHAIMAQNVSDNGNRRFILVQLPETLDPTNKDQKLAAEFCDKQKKPRNLAEICKERLRRVAKKLQDETPNFTGDLGFRVFKLDSSNIHAWEPDRGNLSGSLLNSVEHLKADRSDMDILYELLLKLGLDLCVPIEKKTISGMDVHSIGGGVLIACLADKITRDQVEPLANGIINWRKVLAPAGDTTCVFRDSAFVDDVAKTNLAGILNQHGLANVRSL